jgi:hypothetical protein
MEDTKLRPAVLSGNGVCGVWGNCNEDSDGVPVVVWKRITNYQSWIGFVGMNEDIFKDKGIK